MTAIEDIHWGAANRAGEDPANHRHVSVETHRAFAPDVSAETR